MPKITIELEADSYEELATHIARTGKALGELVSRAATYGEHAEQAIATHFKYIADMNALEPEPRGAIRFTPKPDVE